MKFDIAEIKKRLQPQTALAITLETARIAVDLVRRDSNAGKVAPSISLPFGADAVLKDGEKVGAQLSEALENAGIKEQRCVVCVPPGWAMSASTDLPEVSAEDLRGYLELRAEKEFPIPASEIRLAFCSYFLPDGKQRATLAAIPARRLESLEKMLAAAGCRALSISLGLERCLTDPQAAVHFLANGDHVDVVITAGGGIAALRTFSGVTPADEQPFDAAAFCREIRITLGRLPEPVRQQVKQATFEGPKATAQMLCLKTSDQLQRMGIDSPDCGSDAIGDPAEETPGVAVAAARAHLLEKPVPFEFVVAETNKWEVMLERFNTKRYRLIGAAALAFIVLPLMAFAWRSHQESSLNSQWDGMRKEVTELETLQQKIRLFHPWFDPTPVGDQILDALIASFPEQGDVWAKGIQIGEGSKVTCTGFARNEVPIMAMLDRLRGRKDVAGLQLQQMRGNNPIQFSFTYKWEPTHEK